MVTHISNFEKNSDFESINKLQKKSENLQKKLILKNLSITLDWKYVTSTHQ